MADGRILPNLVTKTVSMGFQNGKILEGNFAVVDSAKPLLSIGKITKMGHIVSMTPTGGCIMLKDGKTKIPIYHRNGVWKVPVWVWYPNHFQGQGTTGPPGALMTEEFEELNADAQQAKPLPIPAKPTPEMIAAHEVSHLPFRS